MLHTGLDMDRGERRLATVLRYESERRATLELRVVPPLRFSGADSSTAVPSSHCEESDELSLNTHSLILILASPPTFMPACALSFALDVAREVANRVRVEPDDKEQDDLPAIIAIASTLPALTRRILILQRVYGLRTRDIAMRLGIFTEEIEAHLTRAPQAYAASR